MAQTHPRVTRRLGRRARTHLEVNRRKLGVKGDSRSPTGSRAKNWAVGRRHQPKHTATRTRANGALLARSNVYVFMLDAATATIQAHCSPVSLERFAPRNSPYLVLPRLRVGPVQSPLLPSPLIIRPRELCRANNEAPKASTPELGRKRTLSKTRNLLSSGGQTAHLCLQTEGARSSRRNRHSPHPSIMSTCSGRVERKSSMTTSISHVL